MEIVQLRLCSIGGDFVKVTLEGCFRKFFKLKVVHKIGLFNVILRESRLCRGAFMFWSELNIVDDLEPSGASLGSLDLAAACSLEQFFFWVSCLMYSWNLRYLSSSFKSLNSRLFVWKSLIKKLQTFLLRGSQPC